MQVNFIWSLYQTEAAETIERHCSTCGRLTTFTDTGKKRRNANGKNIIEYTIYRCEKGHSWNYKIRQYKAAESHRHVWPDSNGRNGNSSRQKIQPLILSQHRFQGITTIIIHLKSVEGAWRVDKLLATHIEDISRTRLCEMIKAGQILFNQQAIKPGTVIKQPGTIYINLRGEHDDV